MIGEHWIGKDLEEKGCGIFETLSQTFSVRTEENQKYRYSV
jgi:hypothetical protein